MKRPSRSSVCAAVAAVAITTSGCATPTDSPFDPRTAGDPQRRASQGLARSEATALPEKLESLADSKVSPRETFRTDPLVNRRLDADPHVVRIDLRNAIQRAVVNNLDVRVASFTPAIEETRVVEADARFDLTTFFNFTLEKNRAQSPAANGGFIPSRFDRIVIETGIKQLLPYGGEYTLQYTAQEVDNLATTGLTDNKQYFNELKLQLTQPLLRDFGVQTNNARIVINRNNQMIAVLDFREQLEKSLTDLERTYWQLVQARSEVEIQQELLQNTINTADRLWTRIDVDVNRLQISQVNASLETRRAQLIRANARVADLSDDLKRLMSDPSLPGGGPELILPATPPALQQVLIEPHEQVELALLNRQELGQQQLRIDSALVALGVAKNNIQPRLDLVASASVQGLDSQYVDSLGELSSNRGETYEGVMSIGFQFEYPLGNRAARAIFRRAQLQYLQAGDSYRQIIEQVVNEVTKATREVNTSWQELVRSRQAQFASADALRAVQVREDAGEPLTPEFVDLKLRQQELVAQSQRDEAQAVAAYNVALSALERVKGTLLKYNNVVLEEKALPRQR